MIFPTIFRYYTKTRILYTDYADGSVVRYFNVHPNLAFLDPTNSRKNQDFLNFLESQNPKSEIIVMPAQQIGEPQTKPVQQSEESQTKLTYCLPWHKKPISNDGE